MSVKGLEHRTQLQLTPGVSAGAEPCALGHPLRHTTRLGCRETSPKMNAALKPAFFRVKWYSWYCSNITLAGMLFVEVKNQWGLISVIRFVASAKNSALRTLANFKLISAGRSSPSGSDPFTRNLNIHLQLKLDTLLRENKEGREHARMIKIQFMILPPSVLIGA